MARKLSRRALLGRTLGASIGAPLLAAAAGPSDLRVALLRTKGNWNTRPNAMRRLLWEVTQRTSIEVDLEVGEVAPGSKEIFKYPFLYWSGSGSSPAFTDDEVKLLRRHLTYGGTLLVDSADADPGGAFDTVVRREIARILPRAALDRIPPDHVMYKSFYLVETQAGRTIRLPYVEGIQLETRYAVIYSQNDLAGAWARDAFGRWEYEVTPGGERQREMAFRLGINVLMYALCLDYKDDLVHTPFIIKRRR